jgi:uncharacterized protein YlzI (FlbEa/FlbD family)
MNDKQFISQAVEVLLQIEAKQLELKDLKDEAKEQGLDVAVLLSVAKAVVKDSVDELNEKAEATQEAINSYRS